MDSKGAHVLHCGSVTSWSGRIHLPILKRTRFMWTNLNDRADRLEAPRRIRKTVVVFAVVLAMIVVALVVQVVPDRSAASERFASSGSRMNVRASGPTESILLSSSFESLDTWTAFGGASFDSAVSASSGSGSARLDALGSSVRSRPIRVVPGTLFRVDANVRQDTWPRGNVTISVQQSNEAGEWKSNIATETVIAPYVNGVFSQSGLFIEIPGDIDLIQIVLIRSAPQASTAPMWVDDVQLVASPALSAPRSPKNPFAGSQTRIDALGNWQVRDDANWVDWFPMCVAVNPSQANLTRLRSLKAQGVNCNIWNAHDEKSLEVHKAAGLRSFFQVAQYTNPKGWALGDLNDLRSKIRAATSSPASDYLAGYYFDNENQSANVEVTKRVTDVIKATDVDSLTGQRRRPILHLMGSYGSLGMWADENGVPFTDAVGAYVASVNSGGAGSGPGSQVFLESQPGQTQPSAYCQINDGIGVKFRASLFGCIAHGSRATSFWGDGPLDPAYPNTPVLEAQPFWSDLPDIAKQLGQLGPVLRASTETSWSATLVAENELLPVTIGKRTVGGIAHLITANMADTAQTRTVRLSGLSYPAAEIRDFFTNAKVADVGPDNSFSMTVGPAALGSGSMVLRVVPKGWMPPTTLAPTRSKVTRTKSVIPQNVSAAVGAKATSPNPSAISTSPTALCAGGTRLQAEASTVAHGTAPASSVARAWLRTGAPSSIDWPVTAAARMRFSFRYIKKSAGPALRTIFAIQADGTWIAKQFDLPSTGGRWGTSAVEIDIPRPGPVEISASFDVLTDKGDMDSLDYVDACPLST